MRYALLSLLLLASATATATVAAPPALEWTPTPPGDIAEVTASQPVIWHVRGVKFRTSRDGKAIYFVMPSERLVILAAVSATPSLDDVAVLTHPEGKAPGPGPSPSPSPSPTPPPVPPSPPFPVPPPNDPVVWAVVVEENSERTADTARVLNDLAFWGGLRVKYRFYSDDDPYVKSAGYRGAIDKANVKMPALLLLTAKGDVLRAVTLPKTTADVADIVKGVK